MRKIPSDDFFKEVVVPSFDRSVVVFVAFSDTIQNPDLRGVADTISRIASSAMQVFVDPLEAGDLVSELSDHISDISALNNDAKDDFEINFHAVDLSAPSLIIFQNGRTAYWWSSFEGRSQSVRQWLVNEKDGLTDFPRERLSDYCTELKELFRA